MSFWNTFFLLLIYIPLIMIWAFAVIDIFRRDDIHGGAKAAWLIVVILLPFIGTLIYLIARKPGSTPEEREALAAARGGGAAAAAPASSGTSTADQLHKLADLHDRGKLTDDEYASEKARLLGTAPVATTS
jgi:hypothetical protein